MRVFIGYGYNDRDKWIEQYVFPLAVAFGCEVVHGKVVYGGPLPGEIVKLIRTCDAMIGFTTRREEIAPGSGQYRTHDWVVQELVTANAQTDPEIPWVEVRQEGVVSPGGILEGANAQRIDYVEAELAACLVKVAQALGELRDRTSVTTVRLGPATMVEEISELLEDATFSCTCQILHGTNISKPMPIRVYPIRGALFVQLHSLERGAMVRLTITAGTRVWRSSYESVDTVDIQLKLKE
jgi:hypothetical protein